MNYNKKYIINYKIGGAASFTFSEVENIMDSSLEIIEPNEDDRMKQEVERDSQIADIQLDLESSVGVSGPIAEIRPQITINNITFTITSRLVNPLQPTRIFFLINSQDEALDSNPFLVYKSNSEIGIWRFLVINASTEQLSDLVHGEMNIILTDPGEPIRDEETEELIPNILNVIIDKGQNYVTTTFMCIELQQFLTQNIDNPIIKTYPFVLGESVNSIANDSAIVTEYVFNPIRSYDNSTNISFRKSSIYNCGVFGLLHRDIISISKLIQISGKINNRTNIIAFWKDRFFPNYLRRFVEQYPEEERPRIIGLFLGFKDSNREPSKIMVFMYKHLVNFFYTRNFTIDLSQSTFLYNFNSVYTNARFQLNINSCDFTENNTGARYRLFFYQYNYQNSENGEYDGRYNFPLNIISLDEGNDNINKLGVYSKYLNVGLYLCKIMEYKIQMEFFYEERTIRVDGADHYNFVGDLFTDIWPFNT